MITDSGSRRRLHGVMPLRLRQGPIAWRPIFACCHPSRSGDGRCERADRGSRQRRSDWRYFMPVIDGELAGHDG